MSKDQRFKSHIHELFDGEPSTAPSPVDMQDGPVLTFRRMTPPPGSRAFSSVKQEGESNEPLCQRCQERVAVGGNYCPECQKIQDSLSKIAFDIESTEDGVAAGSLREQRPEGMTPSPSELNRPSIMQTGSLFDELLEEVKQIQEPARIQTPPLFDESDMEFLTDDPAAGAFDESDMEFLSGGPADNIFDDFDDFEVEVSGGAVEEPVASPVSKAGRPAPEPEPEPKAPASSPEGAATTLRHSPERPLARDLPIHRPSPSQYIRSGKQEVQELLGDEPAAAKERSSRPVSAGKPMSEDQVHDVDALLLDLIHVEEQPPPPRSPLRTIFVSVVVTAVLGAIGGVVYFYFLP